MLAGCGGGGAGCGVIVVRPSWETMHVAERGPVVHMYLTSTGNNASIHKEPLLRMVDFTHSW